MKISFITAVLNEEENIDKFLRSIVNQSRKADEVIIVDGNSTDATVERIKNYELRIKKDGVKFKLLIKKGNRAVGRNEAIKQASNKIIVCSDAGCILDENWVKNIIEPFNDSKVDVVAGYYEGKPNSVFEKCLIPYVLVMEDRLNPLEFLPASRSMAFKKSIWKKVGGFPEEFSNNEDYVFAKNLKEINANIVFEKKAIAYWIPRSNLKDAFVMFYRFAKGDFESCIFRPKVILIFFRYILVLILLSLLFLLKSFDILNILYLMLLVYIFWAEIKNYKYVKDIRGIFYLPLIQFTSDIAVILGTIKGLLSFKNTNVK